MECFQKVKIGIIEVRHVLVLILVLMECFQKKLSATIMIIISCLNPCSNGMLSEGISRFNEILDDGRLNPCSNGMLSEDFYVTDGELVAKGLNPCSNGMLSEEILLIIVRAVQKKS